MIKDITKLFINLTITCVKVEHLLYLFFYFKIQGVTIIFIFSITFLIIKNFFVLNEVLNSFKIKIRRFNEYLASP